MPKSTEATVRKEAAQLRDDEKKEVAEAELDTAIPHYVDLQLIPGISSRIAQQLEEAGFTSAEDILALGDDGLQRFQGIGPAKAQTILAAVRESISEHLQPKRELDTELAAFV